MKTVTLVPSRASGGQISSLICQKQRSFSPHATVLCYYFLIKLLHLRFNEGSAAHRNRCKRRVSHGCSLRPVRQKRDIRETRQSDWSSGQGFPLSQKHKFTHVISPWGRGIRGFEHLPVEWHSIRCFYSSPQDESSHLTCPSLPSEPHQSCCLQVGAVDRTNVDFANFPKPVLQVSVKSIFGPWAQLYAN